MAAVYWGWFWVRIMPAQWRFSATCLHVSVYSLVGSLFRYTACSGMGLVSRLAYSSQGFLVTWVSIRVGSPGACSVYVPWLGLV